MTPSIPDDMRQAVDQHHGFLQVQHDDGKYIVMSMQVYRDMMGVGTDEELDASLRAIDEGLADIAAGRTRPYREVLDELGKDV